MTFDINEARAIIEDAKKRGMIRTGNENSTGNAAAAPKPAQQESTSGAVLPDWLKEGIRQGPLSRTEQEGF